MVHSFDTEVAKVVGVNAAIILHNIYFWVEKNRANDIHFHDGYYWTYNSNKAFQELFPYLTEGQIRTSIDKLVNEGFIIKGNYNKNPYDRTCWYALTEQSHLFYRTNVFVNDNKSIEPVEQMNNTYINTNNKNTYNKTTKPSAKAPGVGSKLFSVSKNDSNKISDKANKWIKGKEKIIAEYQFSDELEEVLIEFLCSLAEINALVSDITFRAQLDKLVQKIVSDDLRIKVVRNTILRGWKSLDYAINDELKGKHPSFDTSQPGSFQPKDPENDLRYLDYEGQEVY